MGWTYYEYEQQPDWFIKTLLLKWGVESEHQEMLNKTNDK